MTNLRTAAQQALEFICWSQFDPSQSGNLPEPPSTAPQVEASLRAALEQPEQEQAEPVAWIEHGLVEAPDGLVWEKRSVGYYTPLYTHPPRREWRSLSEEEINDGRDQLPTEDLCNWSFRQGVYFAEKALKERNA